MRVKQFLGFVAAAVVAAGTLSACSEDSAAPPTTGTGRVSGQVIVSGPLRGASVSIDQLDLTTGEVRAHVGDATTDDDGRFTVEVGLANGLLRATASGGSFVDLVSRETIQLDPADTLSSLAHLDLNEVREGVLVSPVGHLVDARMRYKLGELGDVDEALDTATEHLHRHFGNVDWATVQLVSLDQPATSPTEPVRGALVQAALSVLARDIATAAQSSAQDINVYTLTQRWADDIGAGVFDGNDGNDDAPGTGLQLGTCEPIPATCDRSGTCPLGACRPLCDLYAGSPRALLAGAMTKVIQDADPANPDRLNKTELSIADTLAIARSINDNLDDDLFGNACIERLDRLPPTITFLTPTPADDAYAGGTVMVKVSALDDTDASPRASIVGYPDADGDPSNAIALAAIDTTGMPDGPIMIEAAAVDMSGNTATALRALRVDNTLPALTLDSAGFLVDGATWWSATATPTLRGTVTDAAPVTVKAIVNGGDVPGTVTGTTWTVAMPAGALDAAGTQVTLVATDAAGNRRELLQRIRPDVTAPQLSFQASIVNDEGGDAVTYDTSENPRHGHVGTPIDLATSTPTACTQVTKFAYLLGPTKPPFVEESPGRNPIAYKLVAGDDGVGIVAGTTQFRVRRRDAAGSTTLVDWTSAGAGTAIGTGIRLHPVEIQSSAVAGLNTMEATYDVDFRANDRLSRTATTSRCFALKLRAAPLHFVGGGPSDAHTLTLDGLSLAPGALFDRVAERLLNANATGASLLDQPVINGTTETVYLTVTVTKPTSVTATQTFQVRNYSSVRSVSARDCQDDPTDPNDEDDPLNCAQPLPFPAGGNYSGSGVVTDSNLTFPVKLFELDAAGLPATEVPCLAPCAASGTIFKFAVPPRSASGPARRFVVLTMIGQVTALWPRDSTSNAVAPFNDASVAGVRYTGRQQFYSEGCTDTNAQDDCIQRTTRIQYRVLTSAKLEFAGNTKTNYATSPTASLGPTLAAPERTRFNSSGWQTSEGSLP